jgi:hypothetical protein
MGGTAAIAGGIFGRVALCWGDFWRKMRQHGALFKLVEGLVQRFNLREVIVAGFTHLSGHQ